MAYLSIYLAGAVATAVGSWFADHAIDPQQRLPPSCHLLLGAVWPLYVGFLGCVTFVSGRRARAERSATGES